MDSARPSRKRCARIRARTSEWAAFGEVLSRYENYVDLDPAVKDKWGVPALRFHYKFGDNEHNMAEDMKETAQEMFEAAGFEIMSCKRSSADRRLVDPRTGHGAHGQRSEDIGAESIRTVARREESICGGWQRLRQRQLPESHLDHHVAVLALVRLPGGRNARRAICKETPCPITNPIDALI